MKTTLIASSATALVAALAFSSTSAAPLEKRLMMALSLEASPTLPSLNLGELLPTPTLPPVVGEIQSIITSVVDGVTSLIPTTIPSPTLPAEVANLLPDVTMSLGVSVPTPTPPPELEALAQLAQGALNAVPSMLLKNLADIQSQLSSALSVAATQIPTPVTYITTEGGKECTKTFTPTIPTFATTGVINPLSILVSAIPQPSAVIGGVTSVLQVPALAVPTNLVPLLNSAQLPQIDVPGLLGDKQHLCIKDGNGNQVGLCGDGPLVSDSEVIAL
ncbi:uncharacterized protein SRS1_12178 [Sporisorium reilianum f. sp. reilianum]|uniref:Uncharacterized protein n=1 Tax=Sporisorium reilianum f. sp. reilianum TaxID=72559 RepID=A0A2N8U7A8_9BASI|nr:uncharacterized protein SRS1_12178 [Sporisorium reilianum f. sp. reilianum]